MSTSGSILTAEAIQIVKVNEEAHTFRLSEEDLTRVILQENVKNRDVVIVSVAGAFRKGKSFLLDFFLRYMYAKYVHQNLDGWLGKEDDALTGFSWRGGSDRVTTGIYMWSDIFLHDYANGHKVAIMLLDTQGTFDSQSTVKDCATVFALSTMLSSVQIYNLSQNIQEDDLQHLQLFTEYGRLAVADTGRKPFQKLMFLVRDWSFPYEADYGKEGGEKILRKRLEIHDKQHPDHQSLRRHIQACFNEISCFLMPHPGLNVATNPKFDGNLRDITDEFKENLLKLIPLIMAPENLIVKEINGQKVKARDLVQYFKSYLNIFKSDDMPEPKTMLLATAEANNLNAVAAAKDLYTQHMDDFCGGKSPYQKPQNLDIEHLRAREKAVYHFVNKRKMGGEEFSEIYKQQLIDFVEDAFIGYKEQNESKNIFKAAQTPGVFLAVALITYIMSGIFALLGLETFCNFMTLIMAINIIALCIWSYIRYSGEFSDIGVKLDNFAENIWDYCLKPFYELFLERRVKEATTQAVSAATGLTRENVETAMGINRQNATTVTKRHASNGKSKQS
ncbi:hypothetical protein PVAND_003475 [Polypedilum vanderplanki]|uniref:GB1/RHD3-type G domain-containing protein n=1 Tax=Polypedilum vanderplanki TaxID=319348 RepID=A0A9J6BV75_POLVA|nr:hypothetical protein PVAND_003475 [Polypedilum vanderplanki]